MKMGSDRLKAYMQRDDQQIKSAALRDRKQTLINVAEEFKTRFYPEELS